MIVVLPAVLAAVVLLFLSPMTVKADNEESDIYGNRCYFNQATGILTLKGEVMNGGNYRPLILPDGVEETDVRKIDVDAEGGTLPENSSYLFYDLKNVTEINLERADTSKVTDMRYMFYNCTSLQSLDLNGFVTRKVTNMQMMFRDCFSLQSCVHKKQDRGRRHAWRAGGL